MVLASQGTEQPIRPMASTELTIRCNGVRPSRLARACNSSALSSGIFTLDGHSLVQALQDRQLDRAYSTSAARKGSWLEPRISSAARIRFARPRVDMPSSPVARKVGHIVAVCFRQPPQPLHCSKLATN